MKQKITIFLLAIFSMLAYSCTDDLDESGVVDQDVDIVDDYEGDFNELKLAYTQESFQVSDVICAIKAMEDDVIFYRVGLHEWVDGESTLTLDKGLKSGVYRLLALKYDKTEEDNTVYTYEYPLGFRIEISESGIFSTLDSYNEDLQLSGSGTSGDPYIISSYMDLLNLGMGVGTDSINKTITSSTCFRQECDINLHTGSFYASNTDGWLPIGSVSNDPFRGIYNGNGYAISNMWIKRETSSGLGLFGYVEHAEINDLTIKNATIDGGYLGVSALVGSIVAPGDSILMTTINRCHCEGGYINGTSGGSVGIGALVGVNDINSILSISDCSNSVPVSGTYGVGGLVGAAAQCSSVAITGSNNSGSVNSTNTGAGGLVGSVDSLFVIGCSNTATIVGGTNATNSDSEGCYGAGGIAGGTGVAQIYATTNTGDVTGYWGVGGIIGSARVGSSDDQDGDNNIDVVYNNVIVKSSSNTGNITGSTAVGGICGEAQFGCYAVYNTGSVKATTASNPHIGGVCGSTSIAVVYNALNTGSVSSPTSGTDGGAIGGIVGKSDWGSFLTCQNFGNVTASAEHMAGIVSMAGDYTIINMCSNSGYLKNYLDDDAIVGGIVGEIGDAREWSGADIASCVLGVLDCCLGIFGTGLASISSGVEAGTAAAKTMHSLHLGELVVGSIVDLLDASLFSYGIYEMNNEELAADMSTEMKELVENMDKNIISEMESIRIGYSLPSSYLLSGINANTHTDFNTALTQVNTFMEVSDENNDKVNENMNLKREDRLEVIEEENLQTERIQKGIGGACIILIGIASFFSFMGVGTAIAGVVIASSSLVCGANSIVEGATNFQDNVAVVSQCANYGVISSASYANIGGIVGYSRDKCCFENCLNMGINNSKSDFGSNQIFIGNAIIGNQENEVVMTNCLLMGDSWNNYGVSSSYCSGNVVYTDDDADALYDYGFIEDEYIEGFNYGVANNLAGLSNIGLYTSSQTDWDITTGSEEKMWKLTEESGYCPVPYYSEMQRDE